MYKRQELAYDAGRPLAVVATVMSLPAGWTGPVAAIGNAGSISTGDLPSNTPETEDAK